MTTTADVTALAQADLLLLAAQILTLAESGERPDQVDPQDARLLSERAGLAKPDAVVDCLAELGAIPTSDLRAEQCRLFESPAACPANETVYVRRDKGAILADICGFYHAFGFEHVAGGGEKADFIGCELEYAAMLIVMGERAAMDGDEERVRICREALAGFAADHLGEWLPAFCHRLTASTALSPLAGLAGWLSDLWETVVRQHELPANAGPLSLGPVPDHGDPYECGMCPQAVKGDDELEN